MTPIVGEAGISIVGRTNRAIVLVGLLVASVMLSGCGETVQGVLNNAPPAVTPTLIRVSRSGPTEVGAVLGSYPVLPSRAVIVDVRMPWPANVEVQLNGDVLEQARAPSARTSDLEANDVGYFEYDVNASPTPAEWRLIISPPPSMRKEGGFKLEVIMVSINPNYTGGQQRSDPLPIRIRDSSDVLKFHGRAFLDIDNPNASISQTKKQDVSFDVNVNEAENKLEIVSFPDIVVGPYDVGAGQNTTTIKKVSGGTGTFEPSTGAASLTLRLRFEHSFPGAFASEVTFDLTTGEVGRYPQWGLVRGFLVNPQTGEIGLAGVSTFAGGYLNGNMVALSIRGTFGA